MKTTLLFTLPLWFVLLVGSLNNAQAQTVRTVTAAEAREMLAQPNVVLIDVRTPKEFAEGHARGARNLNFLSTEFPDQVSKLDPNATYVLYCASGNRADKAAALMLQNGFRHVANAGGLVGLKAGGLPVE